MAGKGICKNCGRERSIVAQGFCFVCRDVSRNLEGEERAAALAAVKARIENGEIGVGKRRPPALRRPGKKPAARAKTPAIASAKETAPALSAPKPSHAAQGDILRQDVPEIPVTIRINIEIGVRLIGVPG